MEQTLSSHQSDQIEEKDITLVLEQLQENGFSSFFDHPDCPFSSIQEVDEALKELEKEFLKICEQEAKTEVRKKSRISMPTSPSCSNYSKYKPKSRQNDFRKESRHKFGTRERIDKRETPFKKPENPKFGLPSTSRSVSLCSPLSDQRKIVNPAECGDSKDVCGIDSCGNKYSLKIEVFATVKLEPEDKNENNISLKTGSKDPLCRSKHKGIKRNDNLSGFSPVMIPSKEQTESCSPLVLNYRSSVSKPCPSYMYPTASDFKKNFVPQKRKVDALTRSFQIEDTRLIEEMHNSTDSGPIKLSEVSCKTLEKVSVDETEGTPDLKNQFILRNALQKDVQFEEEKGNYNFGRNVVVNYSPMKEESAPSLMLTNLDLTENNYSENHFKEIQIAMQNNIYTESDTHLDNYPVKMNVFENREQPKFLNQGQQTSFENIISIYRGVEENVHENSEIPESNPPKFGMIDKEVETSLFLLFDQNLINELKGLEEIIVNNIINSTEESYEELILNDFDHEENNRSEKNADKNLYELRIHNNDNDEGNSLERNINNAFYRVDNNMIISEGLHSEEIDDHTLQIDVGVGSDIAEIYTFDCNGKQENMVTFDSNGKQENMVVFYEENKMYEDEITCYDACRSNDSDSKLDEKEVSESSSNETVILKANDFEFEDRGTMTYENGTKLDHISSDEPNTSIDKSKPVVDEPPADITLPTYKRFDLIDKGVGTSCEVLLTVDKASNLVDKEVDSMSKEFVNSNGQIQVSNVGSIQASTFKKVNFADKEVGMSKETLPSHYQIQKMVDKEVRTTSIDSFIVETRSTMIDKEIGSETGTMIQSKSMSTNIDEVLRKVSVKEMGTGVSKHCGVLKSRNDFSDKESSNEIYSKKNDSKFAKWSKSKVPIGQKLFRKPDSKSVESDKFMKIMKERREKRKSEEGPVKSRSLTRKDKRKQEDEKDCTSCSTSSSEQSARHDKETYRWKEISEYETKFVKGVFARHSSVARNKIALRRRAFSNLDQKIIANKMAKSRKMVGSLKSAKKASWERPKSHSGIKMSRKQPSKELSTSSTEYRLPDNTVINVAE